MLIVCVVSDEKRKSQFEQKEYQELSRLNSCGVRKKGGKNSG